MKWLPVSDYAQHSECKTYSVCKVWVGHWVYESWKYKDCIYRGASWKEAEGACERDSESTTGTQRVSM